MPNGHSSKYKLSDIKISANFNSEKYKLGQIVIRKNINQGKFLLIQMNFVKINIMESRIWGIFIIHVPD